MSFAGRGILLTRPPELGARLARLIEERGARAIAFPVIAIEPLPAPSMLARLADYDLVVFISPSAVRVAMPAIGAWPPGVAAAGVGSGTRRELERAGVRSVIAPTEGADSEALLALAPLRQIGGKRVLIVRGEGGRALLGDTLAARGARVEYAECYRRLRPDVDASALVERWNAGEVDAVTVFSAQGLDHLVAFVGGQRVAGTPLFVAHRRIASHAASLGLPQVVVAGPGDDEMIERLVAYFDGRT
ncbi:MAG TPA: uroporphyrinogen-III synthase [Ideonella sp.]|nr:uroporphyrinogen-III synthase [Ideonella sp.]